MTNYLALEAPLYDRPNVISIDHWLSLHPGRVALQLAALPEDHEATQLDIWPRIAARRLAELQQAPRTSMTFQYNPNLDVWKRPETD